METSQTVMKARWTSLVSVQGQMALGGENKWDPEAEPKSSIDGISAKQYEGMSGDDFVALADEDGHAYPTCILRAQCGFKIEGKVGLKRGVWHRDGCYQRCESEIRT